MSPCIVIPRPFSKSQKKLKPTFFQPNLHVSPLLSIFFRWYLPDYNYGGRLAWGRGAGCAFVNDSCAGWMNWAGRRKMEADPFCDGLDYRKGKEGCVDGRMAAGPCFVTNYTTDLPVEYQVGERGRE